MPLRVLHLTHSAVWSGGEIALLRLIDAFDPALVTNLLVCAEDGPLVAAARDRGVETVVLPLAERARRCRRDDLATAGALAALPPLLAHAARVARLARARGVEVLHTNSMKAHLYGALAGRLARLPVTAHLRDDLDTLGTGRLAGLVRALLRQAPDAVVGCSAHALAAAGLPADPGRVIYSGLPSADIPARPEPRIGPPAVGMVARIAPWKGQHLFLEAAAQVARRRPDTRFVVAGAPLFGEEAYLQRLRTLAAVPPLAGRVEFTGFVAEPAAVYERLSVAVAASVEPEPFGQVVVEAMARGVPVVAPAEGGPAEIIASGSDGLLVAPRDPGALAGAVLRLLEQPALARRLGQQARRTVAARFTAEANAARLTRVLQEVAA